MGDHAGGRDQEVEEGLTVDGETVARKPVSAVAPRTNRGERRGHHKK